MQTLMSTIKTELTPFHQERIAQIDAEDFSHVERKVREELAKQGITPSQEFIDAGILALKQYYAVALLDPVNQHAVSDTIDPFWHAHILHTKRYFAFGEKIFGQYIHHTPLDHADRDEVARVGRLYAFTAQVYRQMFSYVNPDFYPVELPDVRLICYHYDIHDPQVVSNALFPQQGLNLELAVA